MILDTSAVILDTSAVVLDTSAVIALVNREPEWRAVFDRIDGAGEVRMSSVSLLELSIVLGSPRFGMSRSEVAALLESMGVATVAFTPDHAVLAAEAYARYGKGNHPARLDFGDCAAYATAVLDGGSLLFVGEDFVQTDVRSALGE
ncbi:type II toxin-antitoxin system VapC family toxin [Subtercola endophyticus]|uniref:type II toxin-antitoxin system VapC family toxin n=1 Tax=Subtercola endophyticus TaxID=2895559 RepID=UPI001E2E82C1|nr:type II toxin-antitoxin system VapC family toxin [Subtercola endophyticus]UFS59187.1 type II toxin-antitoxin system VapC family toxin [Subtercola endophyticus]